MDSTVFKYNHHHQQNQQQQNQHQQFYNNSGNSNIQNNNNQNSIFILNTSTNNILANNHKLYYNDFNDNNNVESSSSSVAAAGAGAGTSSSSSSSSVWSSASSTMCSPAAHAIQKLFNCSSNSSKLNQGNYVGIESKSFKSKSELLKKKTKFWKYLEGETSESNNNNNDQQRQLLGIEVQRTKNQEKSRKLKSKYWSKCYDSDNQNHQDLSELLEYSCSLCDNCRCMDCQISYFDCDNSDDSNSEYSFHMNAYDEEDDDDDDNDNNDDNNVVIDHGLELKISQENHFTKQQQTLNGSNNNKMDNKNAIHKLDSKQLSNCNSNCSSNCGSISSIEVNHAVTLENFENEECCQECCLNAAKAYNNNNNNIPITNRDH